MEERERYQRKRVSQTETERQRGKERERETRGAMTGTAVTGGATEVKAKVTTVVSC